MERSKVVCISDVGIDKANMEKGFGFLKEYGAELVIVEDCFNHSREELQAFFRKMEEDGPDALLVNEKVLEEIADADVLIAHLNPVCSRYLEAGNKLKLIGLLRSGTENVSMELAQSKGIQVLVSPGRVSVPVADFTMALILAETRNIARADRGMRQGLWEASYPNDGRIRTLRNAVVGLVGYGQVGSKVAARLKPFDAQVIVYDPFTSPDRIAADGHRSVTLEELMRTSDIVSVHYRLTPETEHMIGREQIAMMKPTAYLINTARAGLVDEDALVESLSEKKITGAGLDVYREEPLPASHPLRTLENVTLIPHLAGVCSELEELSMEILAADLKRYYNNEAMVNVAKS